MGVFSHRRLADTLLQWQRAVRAHRFARRFYSARAFAAWAENCAAAKVQGADMQAMRAKVH